MTERDLFDLAPYIDHTQLDPLATTAEIERCCAEAQQWNFATVCVMPVWVKTAVQLLHRTPVKVCTVIGFPSGAHTSTTKLYEAQEAVENGATELDVVINLGWLKEGNTEAVYRDIAQICGETGVTVKAILETTVLTEEEKQLAVDICLDAGVAFLKTSTGWRGGATVADVRLLKRLSRDRVGIKASGGIRTREQALELIDAGATRLGTSRSLDLMQV
ncbi:MAG: deoxyribose-phosphate aldolase [Thermosynechococcus sp. Uc]|uniref:deoxyribose-phosphate aldolase n=1 Tax=Thermosynechococcus sp. Uc TaxID=3034853 RepID=UPI00259F582E|nr:deoxyribose-phosphate aldolase [Thermosynechococcus sp. Uc]MDM7326593.1 deoxyribose-phosphate aldolase [Thermosynechococcus sp. Uc]